LDRIGRPGLRRRAGSMARGSAQHCVPASGEAGARPRQCAAGLSSKRPRERLRAIRWRGAAAQLRRCPWRGGGRFCHAAMALRSARGKRGLRRFIDELPDLEQGGTEGEHPRAGHAWRRAARAGATRPGARTPPEVRGLERRGLGRRTAPRGTGGWYRVAWALARHGTARPNCFPVSLFEHV
jgi:hypothetical protein